MFIILFISYVYIYLIIFLFKLFRIKFKYHPIFDIICQILDVYVYTSNNVYIHYWIYIIGCIYIYQYLANNVKYWMIFKLDSKQFKQKIYEIYIHIRDKKNDKHLIFSANICSICKWDSYF